MVEIGHSCRKHVAVTAKTSRQQPRGKKRRLSKLPKLPFSSFHPTPDSEVIKHIRYTRRSIGSDTQKLFYTPRNAPCRISFMSPLIILPGHRADDAIYSLMYGIPVSLYPRSVSTGLPLFGSL